jgi:outer membrane PBP1 activator LpoA protein
MVEAGDQEGALVLYSSYYNVLFATSPHQNFPLAQLQVTRALLRQSRFEEAEQQFAQVGQTLSAGGDEMLLAESMLIQAELLAAQQKMQAAQELIDKTASIAEKTSDKDLSLRVCLLQGQVLQQNPQSVRLLQTYLRALKLAEEIGRYALVPQLKDSIEQLRK